MSEQKEITCFRCGKKLQPAKTFFRYVGHTFHTDVRAARSAARCISPRSW